jgi:hypothetical protein
MFGWRGRSATKTEAEPQETEMKVMKFKPFESEAEALAYYEQAKIPLTQAEMEANAKEEALAHPVEEIPLHQLLAEIEELMFDFDKKKSNDLLFLIELLKHAINRFSLEYKAETKDRKTIQHYREIQNQLKNYSETAESVSRQIAATLSTENILEDTMAKAAAHKIEIAKLSGILADDEARLVSGYRLTGLVSTWWYGKKAGADVGQKAAEKKSNEVKAGTNSRDTNSADVTVVESTTVKLV